MNTEGGSLPERLDELHREIIRHYRLKILKQITLVFLPIVLSLALLLVSQFYLLPNGLIPEYHENYALYTPITMLEIWLIFYLGQIVSAFTAVRYIQNYSWNIRTIPIQDGDRTRETVAIAALDTGLGGRLYLGRKLSEKYHAPPTSYHNREGITFSSLDQAELLNVIQYIEQQDYLNQHAYKSGTAKYQTLSVNMKGNGGEE